MKFIWLYIHSLNLSGFMAVYVAEEGSLFFLSSCRHLEHPRNTKCFFYAQCVIFQPSFQGIEQHQGVMHRITMWRKISPSEKAAQYIKVLT